MSFARRFIIVVKGHYDFASVFGRYLTVGKMYPSRRNGTRHETQIMKNMKRLGLGGPRTKRFPDEKSEKIL
uniref:Uncharacterized protein n=1 Tax=Romanomermis culicivorax TaxID=13658 RepID=A0A915I959_ROMCU